MEIFDSHHWVALHSVESPVTPKAKGNAESKKTLSLLATHRVTQPQLSWIVLEFRDQVEDSQIKIPVRFTNFLKKRVKVIVLEESQNPYDEGKAALFAATEAAREAGLDQMTLEEINTEIAAVRNGA